MEEIKKIYLKHRQLIKYLINGGLTTIVNFVVYIIMTDVFKIHVLAANTVAWVVSVVFAFVTNKMLVFRDKRNTAFMIVKQFGLFASLRLLSYIVEELSLYLFVVRFDFNHVLVKIVVAVFVVITNYIFSKFLIFKK